jgi:CDP-diacylglycerol--glycerol-3-phosphate 3-phosphatidyltransferase
LGSQTFEKGINDKVEQAAENKQTLTFTERMRDRFKGIFEPIGVILNRLGVMPNTMTILGVLGNLSAAVLLASGKMTAGGILVLISGAFDALDGTMARLRGIDGHFGAFVDSVSDRYSELVIFGGLLYYFHHQGNTTGTLLVYFAAAGSVLVSYVRSRGQSLGWDTKIGILSRFERYLVLSPSLIFNAPLIGLGIIAMFANLTALQRIMDVRRQAYQDRGDHE